jgi:hypothetical protein
MVEKISTLEERLQCAIEEAKRSVSPTYQTQKRPWLMTGLSLATGYFFGRIIFGGAPRRPRAGMRDSWSDRDGSDHRNASFAQTLSGMLSGVVTAVGVSLAREFASNLLTKRNGREHGDGANRSGAEFNEPRFH